jgi:ABC-type Fe3+-hydroxamate transport system substrate-binding protein
LALLVRDDRGRELVFPHPPRRVVSLVPSDTWNLFALGARERLLGRTRYCVEPVGLIESIPVVGGTKDVDVPAVAALAPELVIANQEENTRADLEALAQRGIQVLISFPRQVAHGIAHLARLARILGVDRDHTARDLIRSAYALCRNPSAPPLVRVFVPIWMDPLMTISADTYGSDVLRLAGAENVFAERQRRYPLAADLGRREPLSAEKVAGRDIRYPRITFSEVAERRPDLVLLPDEPYRFSAAEAEQLRSLDTPASRRATGVSFCDGKDLFWYGARSIDAIPRLANLLRGFLKGS